MKNKKNTAIICAAVGVCVLSSAAFASYNTSNGYDALKKSILNSMDYKNCTVSGGLGIAVDGKDISLNTFNTEFDADKQMRHSLETSNTLNSQYRNVSYQQGSKYYYLSYNDYNDQDNNYFIMNDHSYGSYDSGFDNLWGVSQSDRKTVDKVIKFMELASDTVVGDLRNNFVCTEDTDEYSKYSITLNSVQIPEIVNAGLSMIFTASNTGNYYYDENGNRVADEMTEDNPQYYINLLGEDPVVDNVTMNYSISKDGSFRDGEMNVTFKGTDSNGNSHIMTCNVTASMSDIGTTSITPIEETGAVIKSYDDNGNLITIKE